MPLLCAHPQARLAPASFLCSSVALSCRVLLAKDIPVKDHGDVSNQVRRHGLCMYTALHSAGRGDGASTTTRTDHHGTVLLYSMNGTSVME